MKQCIGCVRKNGNNCPVNGPTIGHIINGQYVPLDPDPIPSVQISSIALKEWASVQLCYDLSSDLKDQLLKFYCKNDADKIITMAILRIVHPGIANYELKESCEVSFLTELIPDTPMSRNTVCTFLKDLGKTYDRIRSFMQYRAESAGIDHHLLVDGTLKTNDSTENTLSEFSRKAKMKGRRDISVLYAFDLEKMEPVCSQCYPGNMLDLTAYEDFVRQNGIRNGVLVGDKGFPSKSIENILKDNPNLHYFNPLKRSSKIAADYDMYHFEGVLGGCDGFLGHPEPVQYKKVKLDRKDKWLYSFRDSIRAAKEEADWLSRYQGKLYNAQEYGSKKEHFGTVIFESDIDMSVKEAWKTHSCRWQIEIAMRYYKSALEFDETRVQEDYSVIGSEFVDFIATVITFRLLDLFDKRGLLENMTYKKVMRILHRGKKIRVKDEWELIKMNPGEIEVLQKTGVSPMPEVVKKNEVTLKTPRIVQLIGKVLIHLQV